MWNVLQVLETGRFLDVFGDLLWALSSSFFTAFKECHRNGETMTSIRRDHN